MLKQYPIFTTDVLAYQRLLIAAILLVVLLCHGCALEDKVSETTVIGSIYRMPDIDHTWSQKKHGFITKFFLGGHRSWLTHSCLWVIVVGALVHKLRAIGALITFCFGAIIAFHLFCDMFLPLSGGEFSYIHFPLYLKSLSWIPWDANAIPYLVTHAWIMLNIAGCFMAASIPVSK